MAEDIKTTVRKAYAEIAVRDSACCEPTGGCGVTDGAGVISRSIGYSENEIAGVPEGANLGLGCGNPLALATLQQGDVVLDLGSGAGFDCFLASAQVGPSGRVIGVDMTPEMVAKARENARKGQISNVEFRLGEIESLPVADSSVDVVISNCVINLSPDKSAVFREAIRALRPGGALVVSDLVLREEPPHELRESVAGYVGCLAGATRKEEYLEAIHAAGFVDVAVEGESAYSAGATCDDGTIPEGAAASFVSIKVRARKPDQPLGTGS